MEKSNGFVCIERGFMRVFHGSIIVKNYQYVKGIILKNRNIVLKYRNIVLTLSKILCYNKVKENKVAR